MKLIARMSPQQCLHLVFTFLLPLLYLFDLCFVRGLNENDLREVIVVAGNFSIDGEILNVAQYDVSNKRWSKRHKGDLYLYGRSNGVVWDISVNESVVPNLLYLVGTFDTSSTTSQIQYCSITDYDGQGFDKVGEGLCPRGSDSLRAVDLRSSIIISTGDLFVGGTFESRVWDGRHFVSVYHVARFEVVSSSWLPLQGGALMCSNEETPKVSAFAWSKEHKTLFIGGLFHSIDNTTFTSGLALWSESKGLHAFPGGGVSYLDPTGHYSVVNFIEYESQSQSLFIAGSFTHIDDKECTNVAVWHRPTNTWRCLRQFSHEIASITSMLLTSEHLYLAGWAAASSNWTGRDWQSPYAVARLNINGYIEEKLLEEEEAKNEHHRSDDDDDDDFKDRHSKHDDDNRHNDDDDDHHRKSGGHHKRSRKLLLDQTQLRGNFSNTSHLRGNFEFDERNLNVHRDYIRSLNYSREGTLGRRNGEIWSKSSSGAKDSRSGNDRHNPTHAPTHAPTPKPPWRVQWEWLPEFPGGNGPIVHMKKGKGTWDGYIFITGAFDNFPAVVAWTEKIEKGVGERDSHHLQYKLVGNTSALPGSHIISGLITSVAQVYLPADVPEPVPQPTPVPDQNYTFLILVACVGLGIVMGIVFAIGFSKSSGSKTYTDIPDVFGPSGGKNVMADNAAGISLRTLSGGNSAINFRECFQRAMNSRHLPTHEALLIINPKEIMLSKIIGDGSFGLVWSGQWRNNAVAVKEFVFAQAAMVGGSLQRDNIIEEIVGEAGIMACLRHPKILQLYGCSLTMQAIWIVSELCLKGSLRMVLADRTIHLSLAKKLSICLDIADGMHYLHTRKPPIIHRDLKSHNIFITESSGGHLVAKIGDWGSARAVALTGDKSMTQGVGTACWLSPEVINNAHFSMSSDVYAYGIILWEVFTRQEIYKDLTTVQIIAKVAHEGLRPHVPRDCPWAGVMTNCWKQDAKERPSFEQILITLSKLYSKFSTSKRKPSALVDLAERSDEIAGAEIKKDQQNNAVDLNPFGMKESDALISKEKFTHDESKGGKYGYYDHFHQQSLKTSDYKLKPNVSSPELMPTYPHNQQIGKIDTVPPLEVDGPAIGREEFDMEYSETPTAANAAAAERANALKMSDDNKRKVRSNDPALSRRMETAHQVAPAEITFDVSDLTGPCFYIVDGTEKSLSGPLQYIFDDHKDSYTSPSAKPSADNNNGAPVSEYIGDKPLNHNYRGKSK